MNYSSFFQSFTDPTMATTKTAALGCPAKRDTSAGPGQNPARPQPAPNSTTARIMSERQTDNWLPRSGPADGRRRCHDLHWRLSGPGTQANSRVAERRAMAAPTLSSAEANTWLGSPPRRRAAMRASCRRILLVSSRLRPQQDHIKVKLGKVVAIPIDFAESHNLKKSTPEWAA